MVYVIDEYMIGYMAGVLESEGCIYISHHKTKRQRRYGYRPGLTIANTEIELLQPFKDCFGGNIRIDKKPYDRHKTYYNWGAYHYRMLPLLRMLLPYLRGKKKELAIIVMDMMERRKKRGRMRPQSIPDSDLERDSEDYLKVRAINTGHRCV